MTPYSKILSQIADQQEATLSIVEKWANINSWSDNLDGLEIMCKTLQKDFAILNGKIETIPLSSRITIDSKGHQRNKPLGKALRITKHPKAPIHILLGGHMDTVYPPTSPFQKTTRKKNKLLGPGVTDMKGGLAVMLFSLAALEKSPYAGKIGWEIIINPDEELGSPGSAHLFQESAKRNQIGLLFEPAFPDGSIVTERKGSINFTVVAKGVAAHAGRDFYSGRNAITALSKFIIEAEKLIHKGKGITLNIGHIEGGGPVNIVPDLAIGRFNIRISDAKDVPPLLKKLDRIINHLNERDGINLTLYQSTSRMPKPFDKKNQHLFNALQHCANALGTNLQTASSGGVCDGNILSEAGLPTIDTLGVIGGKIHTPEEYMLIDSLTEKAQFTAFFLLQLASGNLDIRHKGTKNTKIKE